MLPFATKSLVAKAMHAMRVFKSAVVGALFIVGFSVIVVALAIALLFFAPIANGDGATIGWDPVAFSRSPLTWVTYALVFAGGFYWKWRRLRSDNQS